MHISSVGAIVVSGVVVGATVVVTTVVAGLRVVVDSSVETVVETSEVVDGERTGVSTEHAPRVITPTHMSAPKRDIRQF